MNEIMSGLDSGATSMSRLMQCCCVSQPRVITLEVDHYSCLLGRIKFQFAVTPPAIECSVLSQTVVLASPDQQIRTSVDSVATVALRLV